MDNTKKTVALLTIATGKYDCFIAPFYESVNKFFLKDCDVTMFTFTDSIKNFEGVTKVYQEHKPFPYPTLMRYHIFLKHKELFENFDYIFYSDIDMKIFSNISRQEFLGDLVGVIHPGFFDKNQFPYEKNKLSTAFVEHGFAYFCGGVQGGSTSRYIAAMEEMKKNIDLDLEKNIISTWHDESHWNCYLSKNYPTRILDCNFCYPESWNIPFKNKKILALDKNHHDLRFGK